MHLAFILIIYWSSFAQDVYPHKEVHFLLSGKFHENQIKDQFFKIMPSL